jgi:GH25 family lysozyme M1 (1,4-beta-N-acetylmuramidase)
MNKISFLEHIQIKTESLFRTIIFVLILSTTLVLLSCNVSSPVGFDDLLLDDAQQYTSPYDWSNLSFNDNAVATSENGNLNSTEQSASENGSSKTNGTNQAGSASEATGTDQVGEAIQSTEPSRAANRLVYSQNGKQVSRTGIDVSAHQGTINWQAVAADGIDFVFIRIGNRGYTEGQIFLDEQFEENYLGATKAGLSVGVYFFSQALNNQEAKEEAEFVLRTLGGRKLSYPVVYDFEPVSDAAGRANNIDRHQLTNNALTFCAIIEAAGYHTMIYGNNRDVSSYYLDVLFGDSWHDGKAGAKAPTAGQGTSGNTLGASGMERNIWFAEYDSNIPNAKFDFKIWQYSNSGNVAGILTSVDMNIELP